MHRNHERVRARREHHASVAPHEQLVVKQRSQPGQCVTHRARREPNALRRARDVAGVKQSVEGDEQVQVDLAQTHVAAPQGARRMLGSSNP